MKRKYISTIIKGLIISLGVLLIRNTFSKTNINQIYSDLCDATFVAGAIFICLGSLIIASNEHVFDMAAYGLKAIFNAFRKHENKKITRSYLEFRLARDEKKSKFRHLIIVGLLYIGVSIIFLALFNSTYVEPVIGA